MNLDQHTHFYLVGIKGVAMTSLAQILIDAGKTVAGCDVDEVFVTDHLLKAALIHVETSFAEPLPKETDCVIYTAAHQGKSNPMVQQAIDRGIPVYSQAEAVAFFFNQKEGIAVCGVGGKSTVSAMITWVLTKLGADPSFSVGVGTIIGLRKTGSWSSSSRHFVIEADEYVTNPHAVQTMQEQPVPRFSYLQPSVTVCTNLQFDHPDVYRDFAQTKATFNQFFSQLKPKGQLIVKHQDLPHLSSIEQKRARTFGPNPEATYQYTYDSKNSSAGSTKATLTVASQTYPLTLSVPGRYNVENAVAALAVCHTLGFSITESISALASFRSTKRRFEYKGTRAGVQYYDDYAHHPSELAAVTTALRDWYPTTRKILAFQPHTFSRTKELFSQFAQVLAQADELILLNIFPSARETFDSTISSKMLADEIRKIKPALPCTVISDYTELALYLEEHISGPAVVLTTGAGDIYKVHEILKL